MSRMKVVRRVGSVLDLFHIGFIVFMPPQIGCELAVH